MIFLAMIFTKLGEKNLQNNKFQQRFNNFEKAFKQLSEAINNFQNLSTLEKEGLIQRFEYTFELSWKVLKDFLETKGFFVKYPREILKLAFENEIIDIGETWFEMLEFRNILAHTYSEENFNNAVEKVHSTFYSEIKKLYDFLKNEQ